MADEGYSKFTTNRVAEIAGVSIGSLYQYFSNKASLLGAIYERHQLRIANRVSEDFDHAQDLGRYAGTKMLIAAVLKAHRTDPKIHSILENLRREGEFSAEMDKGLLGWLSSKLESALIDSHGHGLQNLHLSAQIMVVTVHASIEAHERGEIECSDDDLVEEISRMVFGYKSLRERDVAEAGLQT